MATNNRVDLLEGEVKIELGSSSMMVIQNRMKDRHVFWSMEANVDNKNKFVLKQGEVIIFDYDVYFSSDKIGSEYIIVGKN